MASSHSLGGRSRAGRVIGPALDKIVKNASWRKHAALVAVCKAALDRLDPLDDIPVQSTASNTCLMGLAWDDAEAALMPLIMALGSASTKVADLALQCAHKLFSSGLIVGDLFIPADREDTSSPASSRFVSAVMSCAGSPGDDAMELSVLRVLIATVRSPVVSLRGDSLSQIVKTCYNIYLGSSNGANQLCAKLVLAQLLAIIVARVDADSAYVPSVKTVSIADMMDLPDRAINDSSLVHTAQAFINDAMAGPDPLPLNTSSSKPQVDNDTASTEGVSSAGSLSSIREDGLTLFKNICRLSMKFSAGDNPEDPVLLRGKALSLELLKMVVDYSGPFWCTNERYLGAIKQYLCLSLLKNSALSAMSIGRLLCSIFVGILLKFRSMLKEEIGIFFPMLVLRVLENVLQPIFSQKLAVLNVLEKICQEPQAIIDIFVNYDCDVDAANIFERIVNGLHKTALGVPPGSSSTLSPAQDQILRNEAVKCLSTIIKSIGMWMDEKSQLNDISPKSSEVDSASHSSNSLYGEDSGGHDYEMHPESSPELSDASSLEQRRAYKLQLQKGVSLFNRKPSKGIEFLINTKKIGSSPEEVASFLRNTTDLNATVIGDYLGERDEFALKVMHAYVDALKFESMDFGEAIRFFLQGFRLPGEAQKIDRIMEKFAERYCRCNPNSFTSADTAYVLAYSVIMLNTDAHNSMVKDKMSKADFLRNNRGIDDGKDLPEEYLSSLYDQIVKNEIKLSANSSVPQNKQANSISKLLGLETIFNFVNRKQEEEKAWGATGLLIKHIQEQFKAKSAKSESVFYAVSDTAILRLMVDVCWAPVMAAFSVTLDQSDDKAATSHCLQGYRYAVHVTSVMCMQTQRDAFVTSVAKFTYLHCASDMKQKNVDAVKAIISIAIEDGDYLQDSWEHILTCLSRFEQLYLLGEGAPMDASFLTVSQHETNGKSQKLPSMKKGGVLQNQAVMAVVRGGSYDSTTTRNNASPLVTPEQINNFRTNLNLLDQIGIFELNHIFAQSERLNSDAIVAFVEALCKVSMTELQSPTDPRIFCLTKIVEIVHYNMNRIRLVWSRIWKVLSDFFVSVGLLENLSVAIFVMDSLRQLAMKFLEREELSNYNFQNEFLRPFVIVMQNSRSSEVRELIVRCVSQMVLSRVNNIKSGWKGVFMVFTCAASDDRKNIVLLAFETMEKIVRDYFPYITETETMTFTDCVRCLITFTNSKFSSDTSLNAIAFLRFCAVKLAEEGYGNYDKKTDSDVDDSDVSKDDNVHFWLPLLAGLSKLTTDSRPAIRKGALEVLFDILKDHGGLFSHSFWNNICQSVIFPIFECEGPALTGPDSLVNSTEQTGEDSWNYETQIVASKCLVDLFVIFFDALRPQLSAVVSILTHLIGSSSQQSASSGISCFRRLTENLGSKFSEIEWKDILLSFKEGTAHSFLLFPRILRTMQDLKLPNRMDTYSDSDLNSEHEDVEDEANMETASYAIARLKGHIALQFLIIKAIFRLYELHWRSMSPEHVSLLLDILSSISLHATEIVADTAVQKKLHNACSLLDISDPGVIHFKTESYQSYLKVLLDILQNNQFVSAELNIEATVEALCEKLLSMYLNCARSQSMDQLSSSSPVLHRNLPTGMQKKEELAEQASLVLMVLRLLNSFNRDSFRRLLPCFFPLFVDLIQCDHSSREVQLALHDIFLSSVGPAIFD